MLHAGLTESGTHTRAVFTAVRYGNAAGSLRHVETSRQQTSGLLLERFSVHCEVPLVDFGS
jgi:hypothetical protein